MSYHTSDFTQEQRAANAAATQAFAAALKAAGLPVETTPSFAWTLPNVDFRIRIGAHRYAYIRAEHESQDPEEGRIRLICKDKRVKTSMRNANRAAYDFEEFVEILARWGLKAEHVAALTQ